MISPILNPYQILPHICGIAIGPEPFLSHYSRVNQTCLKYDNSVSYNSQKYRGTDIIKNQIMSFLNMTKKPFTILKLSHFIFKIQNKFKIIKKLSTNSILFFKKQKATSMIFNIIFICLYILDISS